MVIHQIGLIYKFSDTFKGSVPFKPNGAITTSPNTSMFLIDNLILFSGRFNLIVDRLYVFLTYPFTRS